MQRNRAVALILLCLASPVVFGLGLGPLKATSALNEPFEGRIEILGAQSQDFDTLTIGLAGTEHFERAGIERVPVLFQLRFTIDDSGESTDYISVTSKDPIREPFLNFLLELNWSNGRLLREYTVLLDPPLYDPRRRLAAPPSVPAPPVTAPSAPSMEASPAAPVASATRVITPGGTYVSGTEIGPMTATDTLWSLASAYRPDESVTVQQMMLALLRDNPNAFSESNINMLQRGAILRLPDEAAIRSVSPAEALAEVRRQHQLWEEYRGTVAAAPTPQPLGAPAAPGSAPSPAPQAPDADARLELVAPGGAGSSGSPGAAGTGAGTELLREELDAQAQENTELDEKLTEAEEIIDLLQRQVNIKDDELAALQARLAELGVEHGDIGALRAAGAESAGEPESGMDEERVGEPAPADRVPEADALAGEPDEPVEAVEPETEAMAEDEPEAGIEMDEEALVEIDTGEPEPAGFPANLIPGHIAGMVPGGALTILGVAALVVLGLFVALVQFLLKGRSGESAAVAKPAAAVAAAPAIDEDETEDPTVTADSVVADDHDSEATTTIGSEDATDTGGEFDPNATVEAEAEDEAAPAPEAAEEEEDPLEEVNVYLAYERFDQAEELVQRVIGEYPDRHEYKLRLLEVYYSSNDKPAYEKAAQDLHDAVGESDPLWESAVAMWSEMSPERALFEAGAEVSAEPEADAAAAKAFVDITGDSDDSGAGEQTVAHAPGGHDEAVDFDLAADGDGDDGILDLTATADDTGDVLDLTAAESVEETTSGSRDDDDGVLDITEGSEDSVLDITDGGDAGADILDLTGGQSDDITDITQADDADASSDLLDVTKTGDMTGVEDIDLLNVTSPGMGTASGGDVVEDTATGDDGLEITDITAEEEPGDDAGLDFDISDTVAPAFNVDGEADTDTDTSSADDDDPLEFDIGGLEVDDDTDAGETPTVDSGPAVADETELDFDITMDADGLAGGIDAADSLEDPDFDITMDSEELGAGLDVVESEGDDGELEITMSSPDEPPADGEMSLQGSDLDEIALDSTGGLEADPDDFDFALDGTADMDGIAADDTLDMASVSSGDGPELDIGDDAGLDDTSLDDLALELDAALDGDADDAEHLQTMSLDGDDDNEPDDGAEKTVIMPVDADVERQSDADEADTKLNLAKAYIELGDTEGARSILDEVAVDGNEAQKSEAKALLDQLTG